VNDSLARMPARASDRRRFYPETIVDGRPLRHSALARLRGQIQALLVSTGERDEARVERKLRSATAVTRPNTVAVVSPSGGVGKTTATFLVGNLLASHSRLRVIAVDANSEFGTLGDLAPEQVASERSLSNLLDEVVDLATAAELRPYISSLPSGLHLLSGARREEAVVGPEDYGRLLAFLSIFYEVVLLDLGTGLAGPLPRFALERSDQLLLVTTPEPMTMDLTLSALDQLEPERTTLLVNKAPAEMARSHRADRTVVIPYDEQLHLMLDSGTYSLAALPSHLRLPVKRLAAAVAQRLV
jgi:MinD-like ATPase involved in chromosome partitioning or flagellar assembly